jgi:hypothetical protein
MNRLGTLAYYMLLSVVAVRAGFAQGLTVDWKFYGGASIKGNHQFCFYEAKGVAQAPDGHIRVWTKCLPQKNRSEPMMLRELSISIQADGKSGSRDTG